MYHNQILHDTTETHKTLSAKYVGPNSELTVIHYRNRFGETGYLVEDNDILDFCGLPSVIWDNPSKDATKAFIARTLAERN